MDPAATAPAFAFELRDDLKGTVADSDQYPDHDSDSEYADVPIFQGASITDNDGVTHHIGDLIAAREDGLIITADPQLAELLRGADSLVEVEAPEPADYNGMKIADLLKLPQVAAAAGIVTDPTKLRKPQLIAAITAVDQLGGTVADDEHDLVTDAIANAQGA